MEELSESEASHDWTFKCARRFVLCFLTNAGISVKHTNDVLVHLQVIGKII